MNVIGVKVKHGAFGSGTVTKCDGKYIAVEFTIGEKHFLYPSAFEKFLKAEDVDIQSSIIKVIEAAKVEAEQRRQAEVAERKAEEERRRAAVAGSTPRSIRAKSLDEMFLPDYHAEKLARHPILTYEEVEEQFGICISGFGRGINCAFSFE